MSLSDREKERGYVYAYYYSFDLTGIDPIDEILAEVAHAGKDHHSTEWWSDDGPSSSGPSYAQRIQDAADTAAKMWKAKGE